MKKGIWFVVIFILFVTFGLQYAQKNWFFSSEGVVDIAREEQDISLNEFLSLYHDWSFEKVKLIDEISLEWYEFVAEQSKEDSPNLLVFGKQSEHKYYNVYKSVKPVNTDLLSLWITATGSVILDVEYEEKTILQNILEQVWPIFLFLIILFVFMKFMLPKWWGLPFNIKAWKQAVKASVNTKFDDIAWLEEVKMELTEVVDYLKNPDKYTKVWARHPKWILLYGEPWSGKTLLARAVAWESNVAFFSASGSEFMEMLVGMWAAKVRDLFNKAKTAGTAIVFIDEIDAIGKKRWAWHTGWHQEQEQTLNQILTEMDWFDKTANIVVIAATNRPDTLDPALLRAWRFDRKILVSAPTYEERILIFDYYFKWKKIDKNINIESIAKRTSGLVGADIENIVNESALKIAKDDRSVIEAKDLEYALEKVIMWPEKKVKSISEEEKNIIAFHELWHAVTLHLLEKTDPVEKISIVRRGHALWTTWTIPKEDKYLYSKGKFLDEVVGLLWWRAAEEVFFGADEITTWASNDFEKATKIIRDMLVKYGMDKDLWPILYYDNDKEWYDMFRPFSEKTAELIDWKIKKYVFDAYEKAKKIIVKNKSNMEKMAAVLLETEYLDKTEFFDMMDDITVADKLLKEAIANKKKLADVVVKKNNKKTLKKNNKETVKKIATSVKKKKILKKKDSWFRDMLDKFLW